MVFIMVFTGNIVSAQETQPINVTTDTSSTIEASQNSSKLSKFVYSIIDNIVSKSIPKIRMKKLRVQRPYSVFEGKVIRHINIETLDPFGNTIGDTIISEQTFYTRTGNKLHVKTRNKTILNMLLVKPNQLFDSLLVNESERLVRSGEFIQDVSFFVRTTSPNSDSVDIYIRVLDTWSISGDFSTSDSYSFYSLFDKNILGRGHEFRNDYIRFHTDSSNAFRTYYLIPNIGNTYIQTSLNYGKDVLGVSDRSFALERPFFSPFTRWAGGVRLSHQFRKDSVLLNGLHLNLQAVKWNTQDYWAGHALQLSKGNTEDKRQTNFVLAARFLKINYLEMPSGVVDTPFQFADEKFFLASIGISTRKYVKDKYIFNYGPVEDVPVGKVFKITGGYQIRNDNVRGYLGGRISFGNYYSWGYTSSNLEYGTYFNSSLTEQSVLSADINYFSKLFEIWKWKFRIFAKPQFIVGFKSLPYESLSLNDGYGIYGFNSTGLTGKSRLLFTLQTQSYAPWNVIGYRFGPYITGSLGMLGDAQTAYKNSKPYWQIGVGFLVKNENLIINTFQFSISYYPTIPGIGNNIFRVNSFETNDFGFRDFDVGKPTPVVYR